VKRKKPRAWTLRCSGFDGISRKRFATRKAAELAMECEDCVVIRAPKRRKAVRK